MVTKQQICKKIEEVFPEAGVCGVDYDVEFDDKAKAWAVDLHHGSHHLKTFLETDEASSCVEREKCLPLGMQIGQLKRNFELSTCSDH